MMMIEKNMADTKAEEIGLLDHNVQIRSKSKRSAPEGLSQVAKTLAVFSLLVLFIPVFLFFFSRIVIYEAFMGYDNKTSIFYAALTSVLSVQVLLAIFVYIAWTEGTDAVDKSHKAE